MEECKQLRMLTNALKEQLEQIQLITNTALMSVPEVKETTTIAGEPRISSYASVQEHFGGAEMLSGDEAFTV